MVRIMAKKNRAIVKNLIERASGHLTIITGKGDRLVFPKGQFGDRYKRWYQSQLDKLNKK
ncbi:MAG: hypothetical protein CMI60_06770 [Parvibaculum sp.]|nr:hypothetical protein [Parvibaculum sp.]|tara:strand:- start:685 stop:864 length:180 start_codon:yes stop_codon:yes gene_type:complete